MAGSQRGTTGAASPDCRKLNTYLDRAYPFNVIPDKEIGGFVIAFPDLPGCMTHVDHATEIGAMADEIRILWIRTQFEVGGDIPAPGSMSG